MKKVRGKTEEPLYLGLDLLINGGESRFARQYYKKMRMRQN